MVTIIFLLLSPLLSHDDDSEALEPLYIVCTGCVKRNFSLPQISIFFVCVFLFSCFDDFMISGNANCSVFYVISFGIIYAVKHNAP